MEKTSTEYTLNVTINSYSVKDFPGETRHELKINFDGTQIKFGTIHQFHKPLPSKVNYIYIQENDLNDITQIVSSSLSDAISSVIKMKLFQ